MNISMKRMAMRLLAGWLVAGVGPVVFAEDEQATPDVHPAAILAFEERGAGTRGLGQAASDLLFASLVVEPSLFLVDRQDLKTVLDEHALNLSGAVAPGQALQIGQLTGAKILITGSVIEAGSSFYLVARIIGTETTRVLGASVKGKVGDDLGALVEELGEKVADTIQSKADLLVAKKVTTEDRVAAVNRALGEKERPVISIHIEERHVGQAVIDPAAETELMIIARETGFEVRDRQASRQGVDILVQGEGFSEFAMRRGNLISVKARVEVKAIDRETGNVLAVDRQTTVAVDLTEQIAGKTALQNAAAQIAERMFPKLVQ